ncbi:MAG: EFR1 family ferrodoxin [Anaerofustis sp.]
MRIQLITFSPTGTTRKIIDAFAQGIGWDAEHLDLTSPENRKKRIAVDADLVVLAAPVYGEKIPSLFWDALNDLDGRQTPMVGFAVYGNVGFGLGLIQMRDYAAAHHFRLVGLGAFIGEHSYADSTLDIGYGRPDADDLHEASEFGRVIREKLLCGDVSLSDIPKASVPKFVTKFPDSGIRRCIKQPTVDPDLCIKCGICTNACPVGAIDSVTYAITESECLRCVACVKTCPKQARKTEFRTRLFRAVFRKMGGKRKENLTLI